MRSIFSVLVAITIAVPVTAQCTSYQGYGASAAQSISLYVGSGWGSNPPPISSAVSMWKTDCFGMSGRDFPYLSTGTSGDVSIAVSYKTGPNPISGGGCAHFDHELSSNSAVVGGTIFVYSQTHAGADCLWVMPHATLDNLIAHELGHVLGLANATNPSCGDYIMGNDWPSATIQSDECEHVDDAWDLPNEVEDSPPDEETCLPGCPTPIIISVEGGYRLTSPSDGVAFDIDADGIAEWLAWTEGDSGLAFLSMDRNGNGRIDDGSELFGDHTKLADGTRARNGFEALGELDANRDGIVDSNDPAWSALILWFDEDHDGQSTPVEIVTMSSTEVVSIDTRYKWSGKKDRHGNLFRYKGEVTVTSGTRKCYDVYLQTVDQ